MKIAVDAMGGDYAPSVVIEGIADAIRQFPEISELVVVGHQEKIAYYMGRFDLDDHPKITKVHAEEVVEMGDPSTVVLRSKRNSSMAVCAKLMADKQVDAIVSAGHTGAAVASTTVMARPLPGVDRPAIAAIIPCVQGHFILVDAGANTDCRALNLAQFAVMGEAYSHFAFGTEKPRIGLLSVGGEDVKGNDLTKEAFKMLSRMPVNFIGNVEGNTIFEGVADVVICDGFIGNVLLKGSEGLAKAVMHWMKDAFGKDPIRKTGAILAKNAFKDLKAVGDSEEFGGAPLLGLNGVCIIGHGSSTPKAIKNAIRVAAESIKYGVNDLIAKRIAECGVSTDKKNGGNAV
ncbi:MAG: phosphate acyltransferase PlsX [Victivallales bacterium]|nr:phosphate acyltransferase PlsX [Victivallales bacterium]